MTIEDDKQESRVLSAKILQQSAEVLNDASILVDSVIKFNYTVLGLNANTESILDPVTYQLSIQSYQGWQEDPIHHGSIALTACTSHQTILDALMEMTAEARARRDVLAQRVLECERKTDEESFKELCCKLSGLPLNHITQAEFESLYAQIWGPK